MENKEFKSIDEAIAKFEESAKKIEIALSKGDARTANKNYDRIRRCTLYLHEHGQIEKLHPLLKHEDPSVRLESAYILLPFYNDVHHLPKYL